LTFMMLDDDVVAVSPASVYRVLKQAGRLDRRPFSPSKKGTGFVQPLLAHEHWHVDVSYINVSGTFYYLTSVLDGCSRYIVHRELRESMTERDIETIIQRALERHPEKKPRIISDNGPQFIARDFKEFIRLTGVTHVRTSPYYPQSKGYTSSCTSFVFSGEALGNRRGSVLLMPCRLSGRLALTDSYRYSGLSL
jgi:putative transposase